MQLHGSVPAVTVQWLSALLMMRVLKPHAKKSPLALSAIIVENIFINMYEDFILQLVLQML